MKNINARQVLRNLDAPFWALLLIALFSLGALGCFGMAAVSCGGVAEADILTTDHFSSVARAN